MYEASGWIVSAMPIHLFGGDVNETLKAVVGGTQEITKAIAAKSSPTSWSSGLGSRASVRMGTPSLSLPAAWQSRGGQGARFISSLPRLKPGSGRTQPQKRTALELMTPYTGASRLRGWSLKPVRSVDDLLSYTRPGRRTLHQINHTATSYEAAAASRLVPADPGPMTPSLIAAGHDGRLDRQRVSALS